MKALAALVQGPRHRHGGTRSCRGQRLTQVSSTWLGTRVTWLIFHLVLFVMYANLYNSLHNSKSADCVK